MAGILTLPGKGDCMVIFGGFNTTAHMSDMWAYVIANNTWQQITPSQPASDPWPSARLGHVAVALRNSLYVFGGNASSGMVAASDALWVFNGSSMAWTQLAHVMAAGPAPQPRMGCISAALSPSAFFIASGAPSVDPSTIPLNDTWLLLLPADASSAAPPQWVSMAVTGSPPSVAFAGSAVFASAVYAFGGILWPFRTSGIPGEFAVWVFFDVCVC